MATMAEEEKDEKMVDRDKNQWESEPALEPMDPFCELEEVEDEEDDQEKENTISRNEREINDEKNKEKEKNEKEEKREEKKKSSLWRWLCTNDHKFSPIPNKATIAQ